MPHKRTFKLQGWKAIDGSAIALNEVELFDRPISKHYNKLGTIRDEP
jgi:hypothetical protein